ncbi:MAG: SelB C-terminal domain-containing protein, partial [Thioalkalivibrio sp.]|nr:SelB C-terminal domain-containing protein [Thioalkalivibrio sp.]
TLTPDQERASVLLKEIVTSGGLAPPLVDELPEPLSRRPDLWSLLHWLEAEGTLVQVADDLYVATPHIEAAEARVRDRLAGRTGLGPADFRDALDITRKHLIPLLNFFDGRGTTVRLDDGRSVPEG